jgi:hypothetical protein
MTDNDKKTDADSKTSQDNKPLKNPWTPLTKSLDGKTKKG